MGARENIVIVCRGASPRKPSEALSETSSEASSESLSENRKPTVPILARHHHHCAWTVAVLVTGLCLCGTKVLHSQQPAAKAATVQAGAQIVPAPPNYHFPDAQSYVYNVEWHMINAGTAVVRMETAGGERKVIATAESLGAVNVIFAVHDRFDAMFDPRTFCSISIFKHSEEGVHKRETSIQFDYAHKKSVLDERNLKTEETKKVENDLDGCATDVVTGFYYLQSLPLQLGSVYEFPISDGKTTIVRATVEKREQVKVPAGTFPAVLVTAEATAGPLQSKGKVWAWYSDDQNHTPVQMRAKLRFGTLLFRLQKIEK